MVFFNHLDGITDNGQRPQPQEVHLEQAQFFDEVLFILCRQVAFLGVLDRHVVIDRRRRDDDTCGVSRRMADQAFQGFAEIDEAVDRSVMFIFLAKFLAHLQGLVEGHAQFIGDQLDDAVHFTQGDIEDAADIAQDSLCRQGPEGDDLRYVVDAILPGNVVDDAAPVFIAEIHIDIRHGDAFRIEEAFEEEVVLERVQSGNAQQIGDDGPGSRTTARADGDFMVAGIFDVIPDDEEV